MTLRLGVLAGDGIGPEVVGAAGVVLREACSAVGLDLELVALPYGLAAVRSHGSPVPAATLSALRDLDGWIVGPHDNASYPAEHRGRSPSGVLRREFELFANLRPSRALVSNAKEPDLDVLVVRENSEGFYADRNMYLGGGEFMPTPDVALAVGTFTRPAIRRIAHVACRAAARRGGVLHVVHKANILSLSSGMFLEECQAVAREHYPQLEVLDHHVDAAVALLVRKPEQFDVVVTENMFGDILSELAAELTGGLGLAPSLNVGERHAMAQATHGSAPDIAGSGVANPVATILSAVMLLEWLADRTEPEAVRGAAVRMRRATEGVVARGPCTRDLGGTATTAEMAEAIRREISTITFDNL